ncbi:tail fiber domain-containing protein [Candidatus Uhrbacteria bacterium]|nr:tail fiber domain-containing protein [Candidatus Uhrbacteria bacterium]
MKSEFRSWGLMATVIVVTSIFFWSVPPSLAQSCVTAGGTFTCPPQTPGGDWGNVCGSEPNLYCSYAPENCAFNQKFNCATCTCVCDTANYPCPGCVAESTVIGDPCSPPIGGAYTNRCGTCGCPAGKTLCVSSSTCVTNLSCPPGTSFDPCANSCSSPYILRSPANPQDGFVSVTGDITTTGSLRSGNDVYVGSGKSVRIDGSGITQLNVGNYTGTAANLGLQGWLSGGHLSAPGYPVDIRSGSSTAITSLNDANGSLWTGLRLARGTGAGTERWFVGMNGSNDTLRIGSPTLADIVTVDPSGPVGFKSGVTVQGATTVGPIRITSGSPADGKVLVSDAVGNASWQSLGSTGAMSGSGSQYQVAVWDSPTSVTGIGPGTSGQVLISQASGYPVHRTVYGDATIGYNGYVSVYNDSHLHSTSSIYGLDASNDFTMGTLPIARGGTNATSYATNQFLWYNGYSLTASGYGPSSFVTGSHTHSATDITSGILPIARGGTNTSSLSGNGQLLMYDGTKIAGSGIYTNFVSLADHTHPANSIVSGVFPIARGGTNATSYTSNQFLIYDGSKLTASGYGPSSFVTGSHTHSATDITSGVLPIARGGTNASSLTAYRLLMYDGVRIVASGVDQYANHTHSIFTNNVRVSGKLSVGFADGIENFNVYGTSYFSSTARFAGIVSAGQLQQNLAVNAYGGTPICFVGGYSSGNIGYCSSSIRFKKDVEDLDSGDWRKVFDLRPVSFRWKENGADDIGLIAEDVMKVDPALVFFDDDGLTTIGVKYDRVPLFLLMGLKELDSTAVKIAVDGSVAVPGDLAADGNLWGASSGWIGCPEEGSCSCPEGYYVTEIADQGEMISCRRL